MTEANRPLLSINVVDGEQIAEVSETRYCGIVINKYRKRNHHIESVVNIIRSLLHKFYINLIENLYGPLINTLLRL